MSYSEVISKLGKRVRITDSYWNYIVRVKHREMLGLKEAASDALSLPVEVRRSLKDPSVYLYYGQHANKLICVVARHLNEAGHVITAYLTRKMGRGQVVWKS